MRLRIVSRWRFRIASINSIVFGLDIIVHRRDFCAHTNLYRWASHEGAGTQSGSRAWQVRIAKYQVRLADPLNFGMQII